MFVRAMAVIMLVLQSSNETAQAGVCMAVTLAWLVLVGPWQAYRDVPLVVPQTPFNRRVVVRNVSNKLALLSNGAHIFTLAIALSINYIDAEVGGLDIRSGLVGVVVVVASVVGGLHAPHAGGHDGRAVAGTRCGGC